MTLLPAGTFRVSDHRKALPTAVKIAVLIKQNCKAPDGKPFTIADALGANIQFDHRPPLEERDYDKYAGDFIPPQHAIAGEDGRPLIIAKRRGQHGEATTGRKEGAQKTATTKGSDAHNATLTRKIRDSEKIHQAKRAEKDGDHARADALRQSVSATGQRRRARKRKIPQRAKPWGSRGSRKMRHTSKKARRS